MYRVLCLLLLTALAMMVSLGSRAGGMEPIGEHVSAITSVLPINATTASAKAGMAAWAGRHAQHFIRARSPRTDIWMATEPTVALATVPRYLSGHPLPDAHIAFVKGRNAFGLPDYFP